MSIRGIDIPRKVQDPRQPQYQQAFGQQRQHSLNPQGQNQQQQPQSLFEDPGSGQVLPEKEALMAFKGRIENQNARVIAHEKAHEAAAGQYAIGSPVYNTKTVSFGNEQIKAIEGGHQMVKMPSPVSFKASKPKIMETMNHAETVTRSAEAPSDELSAADKSIAAKGRAIYSMAQAAFGKRTDYESRLNRKPEGALTDKDITQAEQSDGKPKKPVLGANLDLLG